MFGHPGKKRSINQVMSNRTKYFESFLAAWANVQDEVVESCKSLPHIGGITKYHLAKESWKGQNGRRFSWVDGRSLDDVEKMRARR